MTDGKVMLPYAIARMEGFFIEGSRPQRNNNPGDIEWGTFAELHGALHPEFPYGRFAVFPSPAVGFAALVALLKTPVYAALTVAEAINRYAPPVENNTDTYVKLVCDWVGCTADDPINRFIE